MTEREKSLAGELYSPKDPELRALHLRVKGLFGKYNRINPANEKKLNKLIKKILTQGASIQFLPMVTLFTSSITQP